MTHKMWTAVATAFICVFALRVKGDNCPYDGDLTAKSTTSRTIFNQSLPGPYYNSFSRQRESMECIWTIKASTSTKTVGLTFTSFHLIKATAFEKGDCIDIYDGDEDKVDMKHLLQDGCYDKPTSSFNSTGRYLTVVFRQGGRGGRRWFTMKYSAISANDSEDGFWSSTFGRILSFTIVIGLIIFFSILIKGGKSFVFDVCCTCCDSLGRGRSQVRRLKSHCTNFFSCRFGEEETTQRDPSHERRHSGSQDRNRSSEVEIAETDIVTISGLNGGSVAPNLSSIISSDSSNRSSLSGHNLHDPPPDYRTVMERSSSSSERSEAVGSEDEVSDYSSAVSVLGPSGLANPSHNSLVSPPPVDGSAPPSYELPPPPSYFSLFDDSSV